MVTALQLINNGMSQAQAMIKAGYSKSSARHPKRLLMQRQGLKTIVDTFKIELEDRGITVAYLASKYKEWLDAEDVLTGAFGPVIDKATGQTIKKPNYKTQLEAGKMLKDIFQLIPKDKEAEGLKKRVTFEEFVMGDTPTPEA